MAASYVLVSATAVLLVEAVLLAVAIPRIRAADKAIEQARQREQAAQLTDLQVKADGLATDTANSLSLKVTAAFTLDATDADLLGIAAEQELGAVRDGIARSGEPAVTEVIATIDGMVVVSTDDFPPGSRLPAQAVGEQGVGTIPSTAPATVWANRPVVLTFPAGDARAIGVVYARLMSMPDKDSAKSRPESGLATLLLPGVVILVLLVPIGMLFGLLSTGRLIRRVERLAGGASAMARGDLAARIQVSGGDEVGRLEQAFNTMAEQLEAAIDQQRRVAGSDARRAERTRIARELHDSISQDVFSANLLAGGLRKTLPPGELRHQAASMEQSLARTMREMRALLLELRPVALEDAGLSEAISGLCQTYQARLGIAITAEVDPMSLEPSVEHAVLRVVQEALGNAVRHGEPTAIELRVAGTEERVEVTVRDDGRGFDVAQQTERRGMGLELMRERVGELGGTCEVVSSPRQGTTLTVLLPRDTA
jgi:signal transduction histidine kinase